MQALPQSQLRTYLSARFPETAAEDVAAAAQRSGGFLGQALELLESGGAVPPQAEALVQALCSRDPLLLTETLVPMEKWKRDALADILQSWLELAEEALASRSGRPALSPQARSLSQARTPADLLAISRSLKKAHSYTMGNVSPAAVCGWLVWQLR